MKKLPVAGAFALAAISAQAKDIADTAVGTGSFTTLVTALKASGLVVISKGKSPFTVFGLVDEAFVKIPKADLNGLLMDRGKLIAVPSYHVVLAEIQSKDLKQDKVETVQDREQTIAKTSGGVTVDAAKVTTADIVADNRAIHFIDTMSMLK